MGRSYRVISGTNHTTHSTRQGAAAFDSSAIIVLNRRNLGPNAERGLRRASSPVAQQYGASILLTLDLLSCS